MATIACPYCASPVSAAARTCPKCGQSPDPIASVQSRAPCRACGTPLLKAEHKWDTRTPYLNNGNTAYHHATEHRPCTNCGDPKPLVKWHDNSFLTNILALIVVAVVGWLVLTRVIF